MTKSRSLKTLAHLPSQRLTSLDESLIGSGHAAIDLTLPISPFPRRCYDRLTLRIKTISCETASTTACTNEPSCRDNPALRIANQHTLWNQNLASYSLSSAGKHKEIRFLGSETILTQDTAIPRLERGFLTSGPWNWMARYS